ncbi:Basic leucine zipper 61 [Heracleum sosnowskyi]|uniref:Basic leucine zipper 61 n=1 Tax=Heracleum sosnowskyi TaxID=360622 RepID=A0AAD8IYX8_9APIA|nr:Basic leucine zipper 61 [Heracleum sosnowskyi]
MAQLPPKVPNMAPNWPNLPSHSHHQKLPSMENLNTLQSKRGSHRRSASDSVAFLEQASVDYEEECKIRSLAPGSRTSHAAAAHEFDKFDEEQFMAMFTDDEAMDLTVACSSPSPPSHHNRMEDDLIKHCTTTSTDQQIQGGNGFKSESALDGQNAVGDGVATIDNYNDNYFDPRRVKRIMANRQSAQRSRVRKLQYISELEHGVNSLQAEISVLSPRVAYLDHQRLVLNVDNSVLRQRIAALSQDKIFKDGHQEALKREIERLRQVYNYQQNVKKMDDDNSAQPSTKSLVQTTPEKINEHPNCSAFNEPIMIR